MVTNFIRAVPKIERSVNGALINLTVARPLTNRLGEDFLPYHLTILIFKHVVNC